MTVQEKLAEKAKLEKELAAVCTSTSGDSAELALANAEGLVNSLKREIAKIDAELTTPVSSYPYAPVGGLASGRGDAITAFGKYMSNIYCLKMDRPAFFPEIYNTATGMGITVGSDGQFLLESAFEKLLLDKILDAGRVRKLVKTVYQLAEGYSEVHLPGLDEQSRANGSRYGGARAYWTGEGGEATPSKIKLREIVLKLEKLLGFVYVTEELLRDGRMFGEYLIRVFGLELAFQIDDVIVNGTGVGQPLGILKCPALISVTKETGQAADTVVFPNITKMISRHSAFDLKSRYWFINPQVQPELMTMTLPVGTGGQAVYLPSGGASDSPYDKLMGIPVIPVEQCSKLGDKGDIILVDMSDYLVIERGGAGVDRSMHVAFMSDQQVFRFRYRFNGCPLTHAPLVSYTDSNWTSSPYVTLGAR